MNKIAIGLGQAGGRLLNMVANYMNKSIAFNSNKVDLLDITNDKIQKIILTAEDGRTIGVGADPKAGAKLFKYNKEGIGEILAESIGKEDYIWIFAALGGGTGSGGIVNLIQEVNKLRPKIVNLVAILSAERDGLNKYYNSLKKLYEVYEKFCINTNKINFILLDNNKFTDISEANNKLIESIKPLFSDFEEIEIVENSIGHADEADLETTLKSKCGCLIVQDSNNIYDNIFLGHEYEIKPISIWIRDISNKENRQNILNFLNENTSSFIFHGEYKLKEESMAKIERVITGLGLPIGLSRNKNILMTNIREYENRKSADKKRKTLNKIDIKDIRL